MKIIFQVKNKYFKKGIGKKSRAESQRSPLSIMYSEKDEDLVRPEIYERSRRKQYYRREIKIISRINSCPQIPSATQKFY